MHNRSSRKDLNQNAAFVVAQATGEAKPLAKPEKNKAAQELGRLGGLKGGKARAEKLTPARRKEIAEILVNPERWHSHGRGIGLTELTSDEIKLKINNFGDDDDLNKHIRSYYELVLDYCGKLGANNFDSTVIHSARGLRRY